MKRQKITVPEAARQSGVFVSYLYALLASGRLKAEKVDGKWEIERADFEKWRKEHKFYAKRQDLKARRSSRDASPIEAGTGA
jgi:excisionase family DNA binding protein